ncbi:MAG: NAD-dependent epimerase/dehydratase family protein [Vicinamibacteria bacterium]
MRVFVAGAGGAIGRPLLSRLATAGHEVTGMTRRDERAAAIRAAGAECAVCDVFDPEALNAAVAAARPEVVVHELTSLPQELDPRRRGIYDANNRIRTEGTRNLVAAAQGAGARRMVAQSIAFIYAPSGGRVKPGASTAARLGVRLATEDDPVISGIEGEFAGAVEATLDLERQVTGADGLEGLVLRYGFFYGPGTSYAADAHQASEVRRRRLPIVGAGDGVFAFIHVEDAAAATVAASEGGAPGIYNVCDDEPAPMRDWVPAYAEALGAKPPRRVPRWLARLVAGEAAVAFATTLRGASNEKAKRELGWQPAYRSWRQGFEQALG